MSDIVERLRRRVDHRIDMEASHTKTLEWQAADEIERLRAEVERWKNKAEAGEETAILQGGRLGILSVELDRLRAEITRLRAALRDLLRLVDEDPEEDDPSPYLFDQICDRARAALGGSDE